MTYTCRHHPGLEPCPAKMGQEAADVIRAARTDREAHTIAAEAIRLIAKYAGTRVPDFTKTTGLR